MLKIFLIKSTFFPKLVLAVVVSRLDSDVVVDVVVVVVLVVVVVVVELSSIKASSGI